MVEYLSKASLIVLYDKICNYLVPFILSLKSEFIYYKCSYSTMCHHGYHKKDFIAIYIVRDPQLQIMRSIAGSANCFMKFILCQQ